MEIFLRQPTKYYRLCLLFGILIGLPAIYMYFHGVEDRTTFASLQYIGVVGALYGLFSAPIIRLIDLGKEQMFAWVMFILYTVLMLASIWLIVLHQTSEQFRGLSNAQFSQIAFGCCGVLIAYYCWLKGIT